MSKSNFAKKLLSVILSACMLLTAIPVAFAEPVKRSSGSLLLASVSDIHYYPESLAKYKSESFYTYLRGSNIIYEDMYSILDASFASLAKDAKQKGLKYLCILGDLTTNGEYEGHVALAERLRKFEKETGIQVFVTNGNHDINNSHASAFVTPNGLKTPARTTTPQEFYEIYREFGFDEADARFKSFTCGEDGALSYAVRLDGGYRLIVADGGKYTHFNTVSGEDEHETAGSFSEKLVSWILSQAEESKKNGETPILMTHWNFSGMSFMHEYLLQGFVIDDCYKLQELFADNGIHYAFSGHQHASDIDITYSDNGEPLYSIISPTLTEFPFSYRETFFNRDANGTVKATFEQYNCDEVQNVVNSSLLTPYNRFYRETTGFMKQHGNGKASEYLVGMVKNLTMDFIVGFQKERGIVPYIEKRFNIDIREILNDLINNAGSFVKTGNKTVDKILEFLQPFFKLLIKFVRSEIQKSSSIDVITYVMNFISDLDNQLMENYIYKPDELYASIGQSLEKLLAVEVSDVPCTKFIDTYGFGDPEKPGTVEDLFYSVIAYMYVGNESDLFADDLFMQDVLRKCGTTEFVDLVFDNVIDYIVDDFVVDNLLGTLKFNLTGFASEDEDAVYVLGFIQLFFYLAVSAYDAWMETDVKFDLKNLTFKDVQEFGNFMKRFNEKINQDDILTFKNIVELVLETGKINYGKTINEVVYYFLDSYIGDTQKKAIAYQLKILLRDIVIDEDRDYSVTYVYSGAVDVTPTAEDKQLPSGLTVCQGATDSTYTVSWLTKYSVTGTDIELRKSNEPFTGVPTTAKNITATTEKTLYGGYGFDFGTFGIFPWNREGVRHTVKITGLSSETEYKFRVGDASKGFWSEAGSFKTGGKDGFTFIFVSDSASPDDIGYDVMKNTLNTAFKTRSEAEMLLLGGDSVLVGGNDNQWSMALDNNDSVFRNTVVMATAGDNEQCDKGALRYFGLPKDDENCKDESGLFYSFNRENIHFIVLNTNDRLDGEALSAEQSLWLREDIARNADTHRIVVLMHEPVYGVTGALSSLGAQLSRYDEIDLILQGGSKIYARSHVLSGGIPQTDYIIVKKKIDSRIYETYIDVDGSIAVIGGASGGIIGNAPDESGEAYKVIYDEAPVFTAVRVERYNLVVDVYAVTGNGKAEVIDSFIIAEKTFTTDRGDIDGDGSISVNDARAVLRASVSLAKLSPLCKLRADVDEDKRITVNDARAILRVTIGMDTFSERSVTYTKSDLRNLGF